MSFRHQLFFDDIAPTCEVNATGISVRRKEFSDEHIDPVATVASGRLHRARDAVRVGHLVATAPYLEAVLATADLVTRFQPSKTLPDTSVRKIASTGHRIHMSERPPARALNMDVALKNFTIEIKNPAIPSTMDTAPSSSWEKILANSSIPSPPPFNELYLS